MQLDSNSPSLLPIALLSLNALTIISINQLIYINLHPVFLSAVIFYSSSFLPPMSNVSTYLASSCFFLLKSSSFIGLGLNLHSFIRSTGNAMSPAPKNTISGNHPTKLMMAITYMGKLTVISNVSLLVVHRDAVEVLFASTNIAAFSVYEQLFAVTGSSAYLSPAYEHPMMSKLITKTNNSYLTAVQSLHFYNWEYE